jgi:hypothetical protein
MNVLCNKIIFDTYDYTKKRRLSTGEFLYAMVKANAKCHGLKDDYISSHFKFSTLARTDLYC